MTRVKSSPLSDSELLKILLGEADARLIKRLQTDEESMRRYQELLKFHCKLHSALHPSDQILADYASGLLSGKHHQMVSEHLTKCRLCHEKVRGLREQTPSS